MSKLRGKVVVITAASSGIGRCAALTSEAQVGALMRAALTVKGRIDVWINNVGVPLFGLLEQAPFEEQRHVLETKLDEVGQPLVPAYVVHGERLPQTPRSGLRGWTLTELFRIEPRALAAISGRAR
jgi:NAD(P)-dependent dehydrogenase (short-subunit alcohol dehydrogenase family)